MQLFGNSLTTANRQPMAGASGSDAASTVKPDGAASPLGKIPVGHTFRGEVMDVVNRTVTIRLENGQTLQASMQDSFQFNIGETVSFQVKSNDGALIEIRPYTDPTQGLNSTMLKALTAANLPLNEKTTAMLMSLMQEQMPIDRASLQRMYKLILSNEMADPAALAQMTKHHIPTTEENIAQFENYKNFQHQISEQARSLGAQTAQLLSELVFEGNGQTAQFHGQLLSILAPDGDTAFLASQTPSLEQGAAESFSPEEAAVLSAKQEGADSMVNQELTDGLAKSAEDAAKQLQTTQGADGFINGQTSVIQETPITLNGEDNTNGQASLLAGQLEQAQQGIEKEADALRQNLSDSELRALFAELKNLPFTESQAHSLETGAMSLDEFFYHLEQFQKDGYDLSSLLSKNEYHKLVGQQLGNRFLLKPEQVFSKESVDSYYSRLREQTQTLEKMFELTGKSESVAAKTNQSISDNVDFMNQLNQMFTYVQLPLKMTGESAHGDLYVFTNKKNLREKEGALSALLHLDLTALGSMDIYVKMNQNNVSLRFLMEGQQIVDFIGKNIDVLVQKLERQGYSIATELAVSQEQPDFVKDFLEQEQSAAPMQRYSFDVRA